jgi:cellulose biosynthesis protein BcsQ
MKVITCFSYKGGAARTTAAANIAAALSSIRKVGSIDSPLGRKVALIDLDVFSAGTHRVFDIENKDIEDLGSFPFVQDYLREQMAPSAYATKGGITLDHKLMTQFRMGRGAQDNCHPQFTLFPAKPDPGVRFVVQKQHENVLIELLMELESRGFEYVILDGESGTRQMADIALRLADVVLVFFRLTWQHIDGTLNTAKKEFEENPESPYKSFYLIPTCVPLVAVTDDVYQEGAAGLGDLRRLTDEIPSRSDLDQFATDRAENAGVFWTGGIGGERLCIRESLYLKGEERIIVFDAEAYDDKAAQDFYKIAAVINERHPPEEPSR